MILYVFYRIGLFVAMLLPLKLTYALACMIADTLCLISAKDRNAVMNNLKTVLGDAADEKTLKKMSKEVFRNFAKYLVDFFRFQKITEEYVKKFVRVEGTNNLDAALAKGKGAILLSAHIGNWELGGAVMATIGYPISGVVLTHKNKRINDFFTHQRLTANMTPIEIGASLKGCYKVLMKNGLLALLGDRDFTKNGLEIEFFGKRALIPKGPAVFGYRMGAAIVPTFVVREPGDTFRMVFGEAIYAEPTDKNEETAVRGLTEKCVRVIEAYVRKYPDQWYIFREMWNGDDGKDLRPDTIV